MVRTAAGRPARGVEVKLRPQIPGTDLKVVGFNIGAQVSRAAVPCLPAGRVFSLLLATRLVSSTRRPAVGSAAKHRGVQDVHNQAWKLWQRCSTARLVSRALLDIYLSRNEWHQSDCSHYICSSSPLPGSTPAWVKVPRCPTHRLRGGDDGLYRGTPRRPYSARQRTSLCCPEL